MGRGAWWAMVHSVTKSRAQLKQLSTHAVIDSQGCAFPEQRTTGLRAEWHPASPQALHLHTSECVVQGNHPSCRLLLREFENPWLALRGATGTEQVSGKSTSKPGLHARIHWGFQVVLVVKNPPANAGDIRDAGSIPGSGRSPGGRRGYTLRPREFHGQRSLAGHSP